MRRRAERGGASAERLHSDQSGALKSPHSIIHWSKEHTHVHTRV